MRDDRERLLDILEAIGNIDRRLTTGRDAFIRDELLQVWAVHHIQIIGEAAAKFSSAFRKKHSPVLWEDIVSMRNVLIHQYFGIDMDQIWDTVTSDLPILKKQIEKILEELSP